MDKHLNYRGPDAFVNLRHIYWSLRNIRKFDNALRVRFYRMIQKEKKRLFDIGYSMEHMRLFCRYMSNPVPDSPALKRLWAYEQAVQAFGREYFVHDITSADRTVASRRAQVQSLTET